MKEKILILVKTYPTFSKKYFELVCTAGINEQGEWRRIYPIPFRGLEELEKYKKYQWIEVNMERNTSDPRPESYKIKPGAHIKILSKTPLKTKNNWRERKQVLDKAPMYKELETIINAANRENRLSLCQFKPKQILDLKIEKTDREWDQKILDTIKAENDQGKLFDDMKREIEMVKKLPYKFFYRFKDENGEESTLMIEDWEIGQLYWRCLRRAGNEQEACQKVKEKYEGFIDKNDVILFLGTTRQFHGWAGNPFVIIGVFYPPKINQGELF